mmetsp:Transcript_5950/g.8175  ORF Transcript_5950/g.8175 Transcript_5950/m.8175 type:complete len:83 (+) Transcript_5950:146-394(+)
MTTPSNILALEFADVFIQPLHNLIRLLICLPLSFYLLSFSHLLFPLPYRAICNDIYIYHPPAKINNKKQQVEKGEGEEEAAK